MLKTILLSLSLLFLFACSSVTKEETSQDQIKRLLKEADKKREIEKKEEERRIKENQNMIVNDTEKESSEQDVVTAGEITQDEVVQEKEEVPYVDPHEGKTRGEIMEYEMTRVAEEMRMLQESAKQNLEKKASLKAYQEKYENLKRLNNAGLK